MKLVGTELHLAMFRNTLAHMAQSGPRWPNGCPIASTGAKVETLALFWRQNPIGKGDPARRRRPARRVPVLESRQAREVYDPHWW